MNNYLNMSHYFFIKTLLIFFVCSSIFVHAQLQGRQDSHPFHLLNPHYDHETITIYKTLDSQKHSYITFIRDGEENCYVVKQDKGSGLRAEFQVVLEMLSAHIALCMNISAHQVAMIPVNIPFPGKVLLDRPASIHTFMPGSTIREISKAGDRTYSGFSLSQGGSVKKAAKSFGKRIVASMSIHRDLPLIVALDTFIANRDRSRANLLRDELADCFYAIDMAVIYDMRFESHFVPVLACKSVESMIEDKVVFKRREWKAIREYREMLLKLLKNFPPQKIHSLLLDFTKRSGFTDKYSSNQSLSAFLEGYRVAIERTYNENERLISLLSQLLETSLRRKV